MDNTIYIAAIAAGTSLLTFTLSTGLKPYIDKLSRANQLKTEYSYEQKKKIKETLSKYKIHILNSCESVCGRLNNLSFYHTNNWHSVNGEYSNVKDYYFQSTVYRLLCLFAWIKILERQLIFLDTTIAEEEDLNFVKYLKALQRVLQRGDLVEGIQDGKDRENDLIFRDSIDEMSLWLIQNDNVISFTEFKNSIPEKIKNYEILCRFIDGISPSENRRRWDRLNCLQLLGIGLINAFGYDYQYINYETLLERMSRHKKHEIYPNLIMHIEKYKLSKELEMKKLIKAMEERYQISQLT